MWVKKKDFEELAAENAKLKQSIDDLIKSFQQTIEIRQTTDNQNTNNIAAIKEIAINNATSVASLSQTLILVNQSIGALNDGMLKLAKRVRDLEDFRNLNSKWSDSTKMN